MTARRQNGADTIRALARGILAFDTHAVCPAAMNKAKGLLLDTIGCAFAGAREHAAQAVLRVVGPSGETGPCPIIGGAKTSMAQAVFVNGVLARVLDFNDYLVGETQAGPEASGHPSDNIPVALAAGSARARGGADILAAIVLGYELYARLQSLMDRGGVWDGVTASGLVAPAMAGRLLGLDENRLAHALALGAARAATPALVRQGAMSEAKALANALVAQAGVQAALLAEQGVTGPLAILDDARGLAGLFTQGDAHDVLAAPFAPGGAIGRAHIKMYPCINTGQSAVAAALALRASVGGDWERLARIDIVMANYPAIARHQDDAHRARPQSREAADHSFPFLVAAALIDGAFGHAQFEGERWRDPAVTALMERIFMRRDALWNARAPGTFPCALHARDHAGHAYSIEVPCPPGFSADGLDETALLAKFRANTEPFLSASATQRIVDAVMEFDHSSAPNELDAALTKEGQTA
jgi:2-methylcitrate dehydratase